VPEAAPVLAPKPRAVSPPGSAGLRPVSFIDPALAGWSHNECAATSRSWTAAPNATSPRSSPWPSLASCSRQPSRLCCCWRGTPSLTVPLWASLILMVGGFVLPDLGIRSDAARRRRDFRHALGSFLDLVVVALAGGGGVETALNDAASIGNSWAFALIRRALDGARLARETRGPPLGGWAKSSDR